MPIVDKLAHTTRISTLRFSEDGENGAECLLEAVGVRKLAPGPDISKYDRQMPDVPEASSAFQVTFEPEEYLVAVKSGGKWFTPDQREELLIRYRDALPSLPPHPVGKPTP